VKNNKLYSILSKTDKYEQNRLKKFIQSPYFNKNETLIALFEIVMKHIEAEKGEDFDREQVWVALHSTEKKYDDVRLRKHFSDLLDLVEQFLAQEMYEEKPLQKAAYLIEAVGKKRLSRLYNSTMSAARRLSQQSADKSAQYYLYQYLIERNYYELAQFDDVNITEKSNIEQVLTNLDYFYLSEKIKHYCSVLDRKFVGKQEYKLILIDEILNYLAKETFEDAVSIDAYHKKYLTISDAGNEQHYFGLRELMKKRWRDFPLAEAKDIYVALLNYSTRKVNQGNMDFHREYLNLFTEMLENETILADGNLSPAYFNNTIVAALRLQEYKWVENFVDKYQSKLPSETRENTVTFNLARVSFYKKNFSKLLKQLQDVEYQDIFYNLASKAMMIIAYYEQDEIEPLLSLLESFRAFLNRNKEISEQRKQTYANLIKFTKKLVNAQYADKKTVAKLREDLMATTNVANGAWLKEKLAEIEA
jgi:hypothetical protein